MLLRISLSENRHRFSGTCAVSLNYHGHDPGAIWAAEFRRAKRASYKRD